MEHLGCGDMIIAMLYWYPHVVRPPVLRRVAVSDRYTLLVAPTIYKLGVVASDLLQVHRMNRTPVTFRIIPVVNAEPNLFSAQIASSFPPASGNRSLVRIFCPSCRWTSVPSGKEPTLRTGLRACSLATISELDVGDAAIASLIWALNKFGSALTTGMILNVTGVLFMRWT